MELQSRWAHEVDRLYALLPTADRLRCDRLADTLPQGEALLLRALFLTLLPGDPRRTAPSALLPVLRLALSRLLEAPWRARVPFDYWLHYVLQPRIHNEDVDLRHADERPLFWAWLQPRLEGITDLAEAALAVNLWCGEQVQYRPTDERTAAPLEVLERGYGRCGELSTLLCEALRTAGIPARQVYVPAWSHCDDNHAWVEFWDGRNWQSLGACETDPAPATGWFLAPASRAMYVRALVQTPASLYACFPAVDPYVVRSPQVLEINRTGHYAATTRLGLTLLDEEGRPQPGCWLTLAVPNSSRAWPLTKLRTNDEGYASLLVGLGPLLVQAEGLEWTVDTREQTERVLRPGEALPVEGSFCFKAPRESRLVRPLTSELRASKHERRLHNEAARETRAARDALELQTSLELPLSRQTNIRRLLEQTGHAQELLLEFFSEAAGGYQLQSRIRLLEAWPVKQLTRLSTELLEDMLPEEKLRPRFRALSELEARWLYNLPLDEEPLTPWRRALQASLLEEYGESVIASWRKDPAALASALYRQAKLRELETAELTPAPSRVPPLQLENRLREGRAFTGRELACLLVARARAIGCPARLSPVDGEPELYDAATSSFLAYPLSGEPRPAALLLADRGEEAAAPAEGDVARLLREKREREEAEQRASDVPELMLAEPAPESLATLLLHGVAGRHGEAWQLSRLESGDGSRFHDRSNEGLRFRDLSFAEPTGTGDLRLRLTPGTYRLTEQQRQDDGSLRWERHLLKLTAGTETELTLSETSQAPEHWVRELPELPLVGSTLRTRCEGRPGIVYFVEPQGEATHRALTALKSLAPTLPAQNLLLISVGGALPETARSELERGWPAALPLVFASCEDESEALDTLVRRLYLSEASWPVALSQDGLGRCDVAASGAFSNPLELLVRGLGD